MQQQQQRIYIGGIDPDRLSVQEILDRFPTDTIVIQTIDVHPKQYEESDYGAGCQHFHVNVASRMAADETGNSTSDSSSSSSSSDSGNDKTKKTTTTTPFEILRKLFHNVTWKGCRLRVELAKPHFLERLAKEREQQQQQQQSTAVTAAARTSRKSVDGSFVNGRDECSQEMRVDDDANNMEQQQEEDEIAQHSGNNLTTHRRHLKIRNRRGIPSGIGSKKDLAQQRQQSSSSSLVVDTKPHLVTDWKDFSQKLSLANNINNNNKKQHNNSNKNIANTTTTTTTKRTSRAVHLVFETTTTTKRVNVAALKDKDFFQMDKKSVNENHNQNDDDDNDDAHSGSSSNSSEANGSDDDSSHDLDKNEAQQKAPPTNPTGKYVWSDDDDDSDDDDSTSNANPGANVRRNRVQAPPHGNMRTSTAGITPHSSLLVDEFASAINNDTDDDDDVDDDESNEIGNNEQQQPQQQEQGVGDGEDLSRDVETNLNVLAQLFPDWTTTPKPVAADSSSNDKEGIENRRQQESNQTKPTSRGDDTTGWGAVNTLMQRYDPTRASAQQFLIKTSISRDDDDNNSNGSSEGSRGEKAQKDSAMDVSQNEDMEMNDLHIEKEEAKDIYRQDDLEQVFREAREIGNNPTPVVVEAKNISKGSENETGFSFAFDLVEANNQEEEQVKQSSNPDSGETFSFSFPLAPSNAAAPGSIIGNNQASGDTTKVTTRNDDDNSGTQDEEELQFKRRRGFSFPTQDLDKYVEGFYQLNDGKSIMDDLAGYRKDPRVKESWERKRKALTSDWKRKRKFAQSRKQKRVAP